MVWPLLRTRSALASSQIHRLVSLGALSPTIMREMTGSTKGGVSSSTRLVLHDGVPLADVSAIQPCRRMLASRFWCTEFIQKGTLSQRWHSTHSERASQYHAAREGNVHSTLLYLFAVVVAMVGSTYAAVPLYRRFCQATGYGGTVQRRETVEEKIVRHAQEGTTASRELTVQFNADVADGMPWKFIPTQREVKVKPGESTLAFYTAENLSTAPITGVSTYNVTPMKVIVMQYALRVTKAAVYFNKIQCFCFEEQRLLPGEQIDMPVFFYIDPEFETDPKMDGINNLILSYTFFKVAD